MLRDRYESDSRFWAIIKQLAIKMEPELAQIDEILAEDELFQLIKNDLAQHHPHTMETGRNSIPVEVGERCFPLYKPSVYYPKKCVELGSLFVQVTGRLPSCCSHGRPRFRHKGNGQAANMRDIVPKQQI